VTRAPRILGWLLLALYALLGVNWGRGLVLCFEPDGHVSIEAGIDCSSCCEDEGDPEEPALNACPCADVAVSLGESQFVRLGAPLLDLARAALDTGPVVASAPAASRPVRPDGQPRSHASHGLGALRTIVLRV
jgi:hypothetical protein